MIVTLLNESLRLARTVPTRSRNVLLLLVSSAEWRANLINVVSSAGEGMNDMQSNPARAISAQSRLLSIICRGNRIASNCGSSGMGSFEMLVMLANKPAG